MPSSGAASPVLDGGVNDDCQCAWSHGVWMCTVFVSIVVDTSLLFRDEFNS